ncbi:MAG TPA: DPP IV N-terminal domain-containing protein [Terriglobales bacterium]|nr:DPP IV N-terminal domain-containing protein [Terriglobales bacterium]
MTLPHRSLSRPARLTLTVSLLLVLAAAALAQGTSADYARANALRARFQDLALNVVGPTNWIPGTDHFWYHKTVPGGRQFVWVDATTLVKRPAFDHARLAAALAAATGTHYTAATLPFVDPPPPGGRGGASVLGLRFIQGEHAIAFGLNGFFWTCSLDTYTCAKGRAVPAGRFGRFGGRGPAADPPPADPYWGDQAMLDNVVEDGIQTLVPDTGDDTAAPPYQAAPPINPFLRNQPTALRSPNGVWEAVIQNYNVFLRHPGDKTATPLSYDGSEGNYYSLRSLAWSPNSRYLVAYATRPGYNRHIHYVESSPTTQIQPIAFEGPLYQKPGDALSIATPALFTIATRREVRISNRLFPNPYDLTRPVWWKDSRGFTFEYNQRGHQVYRLIEVAAATGAARTLIEEDSKTFIDYRPLISNPTDTGKHFRYDVNDGREIIWASERDGWEHLYLYNGLTGKLENQITKGTWPVRAVDYVDPVKRQIWFEASGTIPGQDPYFLQYYRINFDGTGLTSFTSANGDHSVRFSADHKYYVDTWSRVDMAPISELRRTSDQKVLLTLEKGDLAPLVAAGWKRPLVFHAKGRDGATDIWGVIYRPTTFDPAKKYPVVESIYAGPQGNFVPKAFSPVPSPSAESLAELGFVVVQIDGMGTNNRSRAFHNVAWKDLKDAGFPDRILWHRAAAARYPWYDISHGVGIYGTSAGGQSALGALLFHPNFYTVAVSNSGCHDNRMDKIWWNEQWMGWPVGPQYAASSNVDNAYRLQGKLLLVMGELDNNVDPSSTLQVVNQLIQHNKRFDFLEVPGGGHGAGGAYYQHLLEDFFVHNLLHVEPPNWNHTHSAE